ncbi:hypothetical protein GCM10020001_068500 [Nonomuraea salmonea]
MPANDRPTLSRSSRPACGLRDSGSTSQPPTSTTAMTGTLIRNTEPHQKWSSSRPPTTGPIAKPAALMPLQMPIAAVRSPGSVNTFLMMDSVDGMMVAPATPSSARAAISSSGVGAYAVTTEAAPNAAAPISSSRLRPTRSPRLPMVTSRPARAKP